MAMLSVEFANHSDASLESCDPSNQSDAISGSCAAANQSQLSSLPCDQPARRVQSGPPVLSQDGERNNTGEAIN